MSEKVIVPVKIEALVVDKATAEDDALNWKSYRIDYEGLAARLGSFLEPGDLKELYKGGFCEKGIHLHWALPAALTNGIQKENKALFPAVPNRWLVIRTHIDGGKPVLKKWLLESDYIGEYESDKSGWALQLPDGSFSAPHSIGKATELGSWTEEAPRSHTPLTAMAPGNAAFAAIYEHCRNVFGLWDDVSGAADKDTVFSYLVTGWYSDAAIEPLSNGDADLISNIRKKWQIPGMADTESFPDSILCHGYIHSVRWSPAERYLLPVKSAPVNTGVGMTSIEAKAAQLSRQTGAAEKMLTGYFYDALKDTVDNATLDTLVDNNAYTSFDGGSLWEIKQVEKETTAATEKEMPLQSFPDATTNPALSVAFQRINEAQQAADRQRGYRRSLMLEFRALCDKIIMADAAGDALLLTKLTANRGQLKNEIDGINAVIIEQEASIASLKTTINQMPAFIKADNKPALFELLEKKMPRYWQANDVAVLFSGPGVTTSGRYKNSDGSDVLTCRLPHNIITGMVLNDGDKVQDTTIQSGAFAPELKQLGSLARNAGLIGQLYKEAILADPAWSVIWAQQYYQEQSGNRPLIKQLSVYLKAMLQLMEVSPADKCKGLVTGDGTVIQSGSHDTLRRLLQQRGIQGWQHPWTPLYMIWYANFIPSYTIENGQWQYKAADWLWKDKQYRYKGAAPDTAGSIAYSGKVLLTDMVNGMLAQKLPDDVVVGEHLSQALGSFADALLMRRQDIQLPLFKKPGEDTTKLLPDNTWNNYITADAGFLPDVAGLTERVPNFFPVRAGHLQFTRLWMTDTFGQVKKVIDNGVVTNNGLLHVSESLSQPDVAVQVTLPPRLVQPARLLFRWCAAAQALPVESSNDPATNPVCGWLLPDALDQSLDVYEADGKKCGSLKMIVIGSGVQLQWTMPPGVAEELLPEQAISNTYLLRFVKGLLNLRNRNEQPAGGDALQSLFELCNNTALYLSASGGQQVSGVAGLMGQPLALVRASLQLELQGMPAQPQHNDHTITGAVLASPPGLAQLSFPVVLGDVRNNKDGLIGYFISGKNEDFTKMHISYGMPLPEGDYFTSGDIQLSLNAGGQKEEVVILMDPRGGVQVDAGMLPSKFIDLPTVHTGQGLKHMQLDMLAAPFLSTVAAPFLPVGAEPGRQWVLKQQTTSGGWRQTALDSQAQPRISSFNTQVIQEGYLSLQPAIDNNQQ